MITSSITTKMAVMMSLALILSGAAIAAEKDLPETTRDGLKLVKHTKSRIVYMAPDADLTQYTKVGILDAKVAFKKNWQRDYNRDEISLERRVTDQDMDRIKKELSAEFTKVFTEEIEKAGHETSEVTGAEVLVIVPYIINLDVTSVDTGREMGMNRTYNADPGSMTLYLELYDSITSAKIGFVEDAEALRTGGSWQISNSVTNRAAADRVMKKWADELVSHLGAVKADAAASDSGGSD